MANDRLFLYDRSRDAAVLLTKYYPGRLTLDDVDVRRVNRFLEEAGWQYTTDLTTMPLEIRTEANIMDGRTGCVWCGSKDENHNCCVPWVSQGQREG
jgi:hypothetical protein